MLIQLRCRHKSTSDCEIPIDNGDKVMGYNVSNEFLFRTEVVYTLWYMGGQLLCKTKMPDYIKKKD